MNLIPSLFLSSYSMYAGSFAATTTLSDCTAFGIKSPTERESHCACHLAFWNEARWNIRGCIKQGIALPRISMPPSQNNTTMKISLTVNTDKQGWGSIVIGP